MFNIKPPVIAAQVVCVLSVALLLTGCGVSNSTGSARQAPSTVSSSASANRAIQELLLSSAVIMRTAKQLGYKLETSKADMLARGQSKSYSVTNVRAGERLKFVGRGDGDVRDLDLTVYAPNGVRLGSDNLVDNLPEVSVRAPYSGTYTVRVTLFDSRNGVNGAFVLFCFSKK